MTIYRGVKNLFEWIGRLNLPAPVIAEGNFWLVHPDAANPVRLVESGGARFVPYTQPERGRQMARCGRCKRWYPVLSLGAQSGSIEAWCAACAPLGHVRGADHDE